MSTSDWMPKLIQKLATWDGPAKIREKIDVEGYAVRAAMIEDLSQNVYEGLSAQKLESLGDQRALLYVNFVARNIAKDQGLDELLRLLPDKSGSNHISLLPQIRNSVTINDYSQTTLMHRLKEVTDRKHLYSATINSVSTLRNYIRQTGPKYQFRLEPKSAKLKKNVLCVRLEPSLQCRFAFVLESPGYSQHMDLRYLKLDILGQDSSKTVIRLEISNYLKDGIFPELGHYMDTFVNIVDPLEMDEMTSRCTQLGVHLIFLACSSFIDALVDG